MTRLNLLEPLLFRKTGSWETRSLILTEGIIKLRVADKQRNKCTGSANDPHIIRGKK